MAQEEEEPWWLEEKSRYAEPRAAATLPGTRQTAFAGHVSANEKWTYKRRSKIFPADAKI